MAFDLTVIQELLGQAEIGFITPEIVGILSVIIVAIMINGWAGPKDKTILSLAPVGFLLLAMGFNIAYWFMFATILAYGVFVIFGTELTEKTIETIE